MNARRLFATLTFGGLIMISAAPAMALMSAGKNDGTGMALPAGVTGKWWEQAQAAIRQLPSVSAEVPNPLRPHASWKAEGERTDGLFGISVGMAGDVNGDGYDDVIVG